MALLAVTAVIVRRNNLASQGISFDDLLPHPEFLESVSVPSSQVSVLTLV